MIIVQLLGGLGNQMFQYAAARKIAFDKNTELKLDVSCFKDYKCATERQYELGCFNIIEDFASSEEINLLKIKNPNKITSKILKAINQIKPYKMRRHIRERHFHFDPEISKVSGNIYLEGYWQSEKYFKEIEDIIRNDFQIKHGPDEANIHFAELIKKDSFQAVSVHIRRGDYVNDPETNAYHGVCGLDYYHRAIDRLTEVIKNPHFFLFSDDPKWVKNNLVLKHPATYISGNPADKAYEDLRLLSLCRHHIIANSSFSWWGAWLCNYPGKIVIAPKKWFNNPGINTEDLIPDLWERI